MTAHKLERSWRELAAARHLAAGGFAAQAISRAYYAAFFAAEAGLAVLGESRSRHAGVVGAFGELLVKTGDLADAEGRRLRSLFDRRMAADYELDDEPSADDAAAAIADAEAVVSAVAEWLRSQC